MKRNKRVILVAAPTFPKDWFAPLDRVAKILYMEDMRESDIDEALPEITGIIFHLWPENINSDRLSKMKGLEIIQAMRGGTEDVPFNSLGPHVKVYNNVGAYSTEVAEHAMALLLAAAKRIVQFNFSSKVRSKTTFTFSERTRGLKTLKGSTLGILGYGSIGRPVAEYAQAFGINVCAYVRHRQKGRSVRFYFGRRGLEQMLRSCDELILALPFTKTTSRMIGRSELEMMKTNAIVVNVGRGEIVDPVVLYEWMKSNPDFVYATDVWWIDGGKEAFAHSLPFVTLENFIATPHVSGPTAMVSGSQPAAAVENMIRFYSGRTPRNRVLSSN